MSDPSMTVVSQDDELLTVQQVADWLKVEPRYVYRLASSGSLLRVYVGRYVRVPVSSVRAYIEANTIEVVTRRFGARRPGARARRHLQGGLMANSKGRRRRFGAIRRLPSGRYQIRYTGPDGVMRPADDTFETKAQGEEWLTLTEAEILEDDWIDPDAGEIPVPDYAATWIEERPGLRPKTVVNYRSLLRCHIEPHLATVTVGELTLARVRRWRRKLLDSGTGPVATAKAYRLLRAVMNTAVDDGLIKRNPCRIKGAGSEDSPERPVLSVAQVYALADAVGLRYRALILLAAFSSLRWGSWSRCARKTSTGRLYRAGNPPAQQARRGAVVRATEVTRWPPRGRLRRPDCARPAQASPLGSFRWSACFHQCGGHGAVQYQLPAAGLAPGARRGRPGRHSHSRPAPYRQPVHRQCGRESSGTHGTDGPRQSSRRADLHALVRQRQRTLADAVAKAARAELAKSKRGQGC